MAARERKENFVPHLLTFLLPILFSFPRTPQKISVGVGCSWALYDGVGVWPVAGAEEKWPGTEYGKRCYNSSGTTHHPTADVLDMKENTDLRQEPRENAPRCHWENILSSKHNPLNCNCMVLRTHVLIGKGYTSFCFPQ